MADVFISYKREDRHLAERVASALEHSGYTSWWDTKLTPLRSWDATLEHEIGEAAAVIVLWTQGSVASDWVRTEADFGKCENKLIPLRLDECKIPLAFRLTQAADLTDWDGQISNAEWQKVVAWLTDLKRGTLPSADVGANASSLPKESSDFSDSVREQMATTNRIVEQLTSGQHEILHLLGHTKRVRIAGCAGSGKTLVACEKAIRCAKAGLRTLLLCHSPYLADLVRSLTARTPVQVMAFSQWIKSSVASDDPRIETAWTNLDEPEAELLESAFDAILSLEKYDVIVVDEGQDFREDWWLLVEAALASPVSSQLFIFHDDHQALLPHRSVYPIDSPVLNLSKNCRNAGRIFALIRRLHAQAPNTETLLEDLGFVSVFKCQANAEEANLITALEELCSQNLLLGSKIILLAGGLEHTDLMTAGIGRTRQVPVTWQEAIEHYFARLYSTRDETISLTSAQFSNLLGRLKALGASAFPSKTDVALVLELANSVGVANGNNGRARSDLQWTIVNGKLRLRKANGATISNAERLLFFRQESWTEGLPSPTGWRVSNDGMDIDFEESIQVSDIGSFKGLEADTVIVLAGNRVPIADAQLYVAMSRARLSLALIDCGAGLQLPHKSSDLDYILYERL